MQKHARPRYRKSVELPSTLLDHVTICFEEGLYSQGFALLTSTLTAGNGTPRPAYVPPSQFFAVAATLSVHPSMTTRTDSEDKHNAADDALRYLRLAGQIVGVADSPIREAVHFGKSELRAQRAQSRRSLDQEDRPSEKLKCIYLTEKQSLWDRADDFCHVLGWALNCSIVEPKRWARWKLLLSILLDALEDDLQQVINENAPPDSSQLSANALDGTILMHYLGTANGRNDKRRVMRAVMADGTAKSLAEFSQIWQNETAGPKARVEKTKVHKKLDIDKGHYGDYDEVSDEELTRTVLSLEAATQVIPTEAAHDYSDQDAMTIRLRVFALLTKLCNAEPEAFLTAEDLFDLYADYFRILPLKQYQDLVFGLGVLLDEHSQSSLYQALLKGVIDSAAPVYDQNDLTQEDFEQYFAPYAANLSGVADNAKVALLVEALMRLLWQHDLLRYSPELEKKIEEGVRARTKRASGQTCDYNIQCLQSSGERVLAIIKMLRQ